MKYSGKRIIAVLSIVLLIFGLCSCAQKEGTDIQTDSDKKISGKSSKEQFVTGGTITLGSYPQSRVTDEDILSKLNAQSLNWISYEYYSGDINSEYGYMLPGDWMKYADVSLGGEKYRAVIIDEYRPWDTRNSTNRSHSEQSYAGFETDIVYWYKFEPLKWKVLDAESGLILSESIIDSQPFNNYIYRLYAIDNGAGNYGYFVDENKTIPVNDWANSSIREWLNSDFYSTAFSGNETSKIQNSTVINDGIQSWIFDQTNYNYDYADTQDKVFLLSADDVLNTAYGFSSETEESETRTSKGTDYAIIQGLDDQGTSCWMLRSTENVGRINGMGPEEISLVNYNGDPSFARTYSTNLGIRPAMKINY